MIDLSRSLIDQLQLKIGWKNQETRDCRLIFVFFSYWNVEYHALVDLGGKGRIFPKNEKKIKNCIFHWNFGCESKKRSIWGKKLYDFKNFGSPPPPLQKMLRIRHSYCILLLKLLQIYEYSFPWYWAFRINATFQICRSNQLLKNRFKNHFIW